MPTGSHMCEKWPSLYYTVFKFHVPKSTIFLFKNNHGHTRTHTRTHTQRERVRETHQRVLFSSVLQNATVAFMATFGHIILTDSELTLSLFVIIHILVTFPWNLNLCGEPDEPDG